MSEQAHDTTGELPAGMKDKLIDTISEFYLDGFNWMIYKSYLEGTELDKAFFMNAMDVPIVLMLKKDIQRDIIKGQIEEAVSLGFVEAYEDDYENALMSGVGALAFDVTEKGREYILPYIQKGLISHYQGAIEKIGAIK